MVSVGFPRFIEVFCRGLQSLLNLPGNKSFYQEALFSFIHFFLAAQLPLDQWQSSIDLKSFFALNLESMR
jgi:hypothetical protein